MAEKMSTLVLTVDLDCCRCNKKVRKLLSEFPEIKMLNFDNKQNKVTISGPFDPEMLKKKLWCNACSCIKNIEIPPPKDPPKPPPKDPPKPPPDPPKPPPDPQVNLIVVCPCGPNVCCKPSCEGKCRCPDPEPVVPFRPSCEGTCRCPNMCCKPYVQGYPSHGTCKCRRPGCDSWCGSYC